MATVLYPTRGGDTTYRNQDRASELARERNALLLFLYVTNVSFLNRLGGPVRVDILEAELDDLGEFLLALAQERAKKVGVESERLIRHGRFRDALKTVIKERAVTTLVLGRPAHDAAITTIEFISHLAQTMTGEFGIEVFVVHEGEVVEQYQPGDVAEAGE
jgi:nucleotide-binding universal stress UspA family protein